MTKLEFAENGLHAQFIVDDRGRLYLLNLSDSRRDIPDDLRMESDIAATTEVETAGARIRGNRHIFNQCPRCRAMTATPTRAMPPAAC